MCAAASVCRQSSMEGRAEWAPGPGAVRARHAAGAPASATGRVVESTQAEDRRLISLVGARPLLYARSTLPVASYYSQVKKLWQEVADLMDWTVPEVRRKWSHIRNSYSRHLRNEIHGVRTGRGRMVSRWYLADDLEFLRHHMATDTRPSASSYSMVSPFAPSVLKMEYSEQEPGWYSAPEPAPAPRDDACSANSCDSDENTDYFHFFRGLYKDYQELAPYKQRKFRRQCMILLHELVDGEGAHAHMRGEAGQEEAGSSAGEGSEEGQGDRKCFVQELRIVRAEGSLSPVLPPDPAAGGVSELDVPPHSPYTECIVPDQPAADDTTPPHDLSTPSTFNDSGVPTATRLNKIHRKQKFPSQRSTSIT